MIKVEGISKSFGRKTVIKNIDVAFEPSKTNLVIGGSGTGKTTLLKCMIGLIEPDSGSVFFDDINFTKQNPNDRKKIRRNIGMLFQNGALFDSMTVEQNIMFPLRIIAKDKSELNRKRRVNSVLERVGLEGTNHLFPSELSGGMRKRVGVARAIVTNPKYLFVDEPNSGLDPHNSLIIDRLIADLTKELEMVTIIITHDMNSIFEVGDKVFFMHEGEITWQGDGKEIFKTNNEQLEQFLYTRKTFNLIRQALQNNPI